MPKEDQHGQVKLAVHTYIYLLAKSTSSEATYTANYFATELIGPSEPIVSVDTVALCDCTHTVGHNTTNQGPEALCEGIKALQHQPRQLFIVQKM